MTRFPHPPVIAATRPEKADTPSFFPAGKSHTAHFYSSDELLIREVSQRLAMALDAGGAAVVIATPAHRAAFEEQLQGRGLDLARIARQGRWLALDAEAMLAEFVVEGWPDAKKFLSLLGSILDSLVAAAQSTTGSEQPLLAAYGEMVSVLWEKGKTGAAIRLEELWNELAQERAFHLSCGWPLRFFSRDTEGVVVERICAEHTHVLPPNGYESMSEEERRRRAVFWQLHTQALEEETRYGQLKADEAQMRLAAIVESSNDAIVSKDLNGIVTSWNKAAERILGYTAAEMIGRSITTVIPPELHQDEVEILRKIHAGERIEHFETVRVTKSGERLDVSLTISPVRDSQGRIVGAAKILRDITMQKKLEAALRTTERLASVGRLAATVAHEINNPLEAVTNLIYLVRRHPDLPDAIRGCLEMADEELRRVSHIARQTLGFYRDTTSPVWINVPEVVDEMLAIYQRRFAYKQIAVRKRIAPGLRVRVLHGEFKQIISNLVSNAIDASPQGGAIEVRAWQSTHPLTGAPGIQLVVADQGCGIPEAIRRQIFAPFFTTKKDVGTGLGLWIVKSMLVKTGGWIRCRSRVAERGTSGSGTAMMVFLASDTEPEVPALAA